MTQWIENDGGRKAAGFEGKTGDCVTRAIAIATGLPYQEVYDTLFKLTGSSPRNGVWRKDYQTYLETLGWKWVPTMKIGQGCKVHLRADELPSGALIARLSRHLCAVKDGVVHDTHDPSRGGRRCVYGYFYKPGAV
jgi:hypothetical protein